MGSGIGWRDVWAERSASTMSTSDSFVSSDPSSSEARAALAAFFFDAFDGAADEEASSWAARFSSSGTVRLLEGSSW